MQFVFLQNIPAFHSAFVLLSKRKPGRSQDPRQRPLIPPALEILFRLPEKEWKAKGQFQKLSLVDTGLRQVENNIKGNMFAPARARDPMQIVDSMRRIQSISKNTLCQSLAEGVPYQFLDTLRGVVAVCRDCRRPLSLLKWQQDFFHWEYIVQKNCLDFH